MVNSRETASLRFGIQMLEYSKVRNERRVKWAPETQQGPKVRTETVGRTSRKTSVKKKEVAGHIFSLSSDSLCRRRGLSLPMHGDSRQSQRPPRKNAPVEQSSGRSSLYWLASYLASDIPQERVIGQ